MNKKSSGSRSRKQSLRAVGTRCADHATPLYPQKLALTSPTCSGRSVGIVRSRTKTTEYWTIKICFVSRYGLHSRVLVIMLVRFGSVKFEDILTRCVAVALKKKSVLLFVLIMGNHV